MHNNTMNNNKRPLMSLNAPTPCSKRKRVSFATTTSVHDTLRDAATCQESWLTKETIMDLVRSHPKTVQQAQATDPTSFNRHCELLATTYTNSVVQGDSPESLSSSIPAASLSCSHLLGMSNSLSLRGLETFVLSSVASDRMQRRRRHQSTMLKAQVKLSKNTQEERSSLMRQLSERLTASSRTFALAMGAADTYSAMMEHASSMTTRLHHDNSITTRVAAVSTATTPRQHDSHAKAALSTSLPMEPAAKRRCTPCKIVSPMA